MSRLHGRLVTVLDQIVSSASNFLLVAVVAHSSSPARFGEFSLAYVLLIFFLGFGRALVGEVMMVRGSSGQTPPDFAGATGLSLCVGGLGSAALIVGALLTRGHVDVWLLLAAAMPVVLLQDVQRYVLICCRLSGRALALDVVWLLVAAGGMVLSRVLDGGAPGVVGAWSIGGVCSVILGQALVRARPRPVTGYRWLMANRTLSTRFSAEFAALNGSNALVWFLLAAPLGATGLAALRGASLLFSPLNTGFNAVRIAMIPELVRTRGTPAYRKALGWVGLALSVPCVVWGAAVMLLPNHLGELLLGQTWIGAEPLRLPYFVQALAMVGYTLLLSYFRSSGRHPESSKMRGVLAGTTLLAPTVLAWVGGPPGGAWGFAGAVTLAAAAGLLLSRSWPRSVLVEGAA